MVEDIRNSIGVLLVEACKEGNIDFLKEKEVSGELNPLKITEFDRWNWLHSANMLRPSPPVTMHFFIDRGVDVNAKDRYDMTPLHYAMRIKNVEAAKVLLEAGANPNIPNEKKIIPLAYINGQPKELELLKLMLDKGGDVHFHNGYETIIEGIKERSLSEEEFIPVLEMMEKYA